LGVSEPFAEKAEWLVALSDNATNVLVAGISLHDEWLIKLSVS
jgi:hypothetical protein